jgi:hypothetical protein
MENRLDIYTGDYRQKLRMECDNQSEILIFDARVRKIFLNPICKKLLF